MDVVHDVRLKVKKLDDKCYRELHLPKSSNFEGLIEAIVAKLKIDRQSIEEVIKYRQGDPEGTLVDDENDVAHLENGARLVITMKSEE